MATLGTAAAGHAITIAALLRDDDDRVRIAAAQALDQLGDDAVVAAAPYVVGALRGDAKLAEVCRAVLAARKSRVEAALVAGLETPDQVHGMRIADVICALPNARELLFAAFDGEAQNVQINAAFGIAKLGVKRAGVEGRQRLLNGLPGPPTRRRDAMVKALAMLGESPAR
jgi:HEAT repeat protein